MKRIVFFGIFLFPFFLISFSQGFYKLDWYDEFNGEALDLTKWDYQLGTGGSENLQYWGNNEKEYYTKENLRLEDGMLVITAKKESISGMPYTSSRIYTRGKYATAFGRIEARIALPGGTGLWPAFWMLPQNSPYGGWASSGEIDIMEAKGRLPNVYSGAIHFGGEWPRNQYTTTGDYRFPNNETIEDFHLYAVEWTNKDITWLCDNIVLKKATYWQSEKGTFPAPFDVPFYILFNMAVGGNFDENRVPDSSFTSAEMKVDYVRVYKWDDYLKEPEIPEESANIPTFKGDTAFRIVQTDSYIEVKSNIPLQEISVYSLTGNLAAKTSSSFFNISHFAKGVYLLKAKGIDNLSQSFKIII